MEPSTPLEHILIASNKAGMVRFLDEHNDDLEELINLAIADKQPFSWKAAWLLGGYIERGDRRMEGYADQIINSIPSKMANQKRDLLRVVDKLNLNDDQEGKVYDIALGLWEHIGLAPAVRYNAFKQMVRFARKYPELKHEIDLLTQGHYFENLSRGVKHSVRKMISSL
jgi:hypothetical protein